ncbi:hypothetical protein [Candidatus Thioglobus sp. NP1]|uniref:hypothetical protein n=1 Tax=Candidatus Thioglobus sp. NP1 TaxID=2508687 RepID=UPI000DEDC4B1|nr:hypothetical protein [Candidatus Thioglobus sp. NP1]AXE61726.1 hypothetical protein CRN91_03435 [Candidatus Thioglobus sp. NP1]
MKIIFLVDSNFSIREFERFGIYEMLNQQISIYVFDFRFFKKDEEYLEESFEKNFSDNRVKNIKILDYSDPKSFYLDLLDGFVIDNRSKSYINFSTSWIKDSGAKLIELDQGLIPTSIWKPSIYDLLVMAKNTFLIYGYKKLFNQTTIYVANRFRSFFSINANHIYADIKVCSGLASKCNLGESEVRSHAFDYDIFLEQKNKTDKIIQEEYAVFLDSGIVSHPDSGRLGNLPAENNESYYPALRAFFDDFEERMKVKIVIAMHPRIVPSKDYIASFGGRKLISKDTSMLVRNSKMVIAHNSTSINFAVLWKIPLLIITTTKIDRVDYNIMKSLEEIFNTKRININKPYKDKDYIEISKGVVKYYESYKKFLIKVPNSPDLNSAKILIKSLKNYVE